MAMQGGIVRTAAMERIWTMKHLYIILMLAVIVAIPALLPADSDGPAQKALGTYKIKGRELFNGDLYELTGKVELVEEQITVSLTYRKAGHPSLDFEGIFKTKLTEILFEELKVNGTIRRTFVLKSKIEASEDEDAAATLKPDGWVKIRKTQDETFAFTLHYAFDVEGDRYRGGGKGQQG